MITSSGVIACVINVHGHIDSEVLQEAEILEMSIMCYLDEILWKIVSDICMLFSF